MICNNCKKEIPENFKFCTNCGEEVNSVSTTPEKKKGMKSIVTSIVSILVFLIAFGAVKYLMQETISPSYSTPDLATEAVKQAKTTITLPSKIDEVTTLINITAEQGAIRYHYILSGLDTDQLSNTQFRNYLKPSICENKETKYLLDEGVGMQYAYTVENSTQTYFISFTKSDCI